MIDSNVDGTKNVVNLCLEKESKSYAMSVQLLLYVDSKKIKKN